jgi:acyl carrier protein
VDEVIAQVKRVIVEGLRLDKVKPEDIGDDQPLFGGALGLDSVDALELVLEVERHFGVRIEDDAEGRAVLRSPRTLAAHIVAKKGA